ncbi:MAG TPA: SMP-30/gluconolactonase/LRE family protein [Ilumatobacteraceae bacterium]
MTSGLAFPEGPVALADGSVIIVEMLAMRLVRVYPDGSVDTIAQMPGGPNGAARAPDGSIIVCNNGGKFAGAAATGDLSADPGDLYIGGRIQAVDIATGTVTDLYHECDGNPLAAPNDLVFDEHGGFYFTDNGMARGRTAQVSGIYYGKTDGSSIVEVEFPAWDANGIGISPDGQTLYWAESVTARVMRRKIIAPGVVERCDLLNPWGCLHGLGGMQMLDSLAVDGEGNVSVGTLITGGITTISPDGELVDFIPTGDIMTTNICFGGDDLATAYLTLSATGRLMTGQWPRPGLALHYQDRG